MARTPRRRASRAAAAVLLTAAILAPAAMPVSGQEPVVLRVGTTQDLDAVNPFTTALVVGFEVFTLNYELLTSFDGNLEPAPGFAESWTSNDDQTEWTFKIPAGKLWSDGQPATAEDARWTYQFVLDSVASDLGATGLGYLDTYLVDSGVTAVAAPDAETLVVTLDRPGDRLLGGYVPILPKHIWESQTPETVNDYLNNPPIVGSGPYQAVEWATGQFIRFARNPNWSGSALAADEVVIQIFESSDTMVQALRTGALDYAQNVNPDQFDQLATVDGITTVAGTANGFTQLGFNAYGTGTGNVIEGGGPSTPALQDAAFRDALGYAIDKELLIERVLGGYGEVGTTQVPRFQTNWHVEPETPRTFDLGLAAQKLEDAGYTTNASGQRLDKDGNPIVLRMVFPDSDPGYAQSAEFIQGWFGDVGVEVTAQQYDSDTLIELMLPPEAGDGFTADYDLFIWGWGGDVDPTSLLYIFTCGEIGNSSDSLWCDPRYDELYAEQNEAVTDEERYDAMAQLQQYFYEQAPYHVLYYDAALHAYRTDRFTGWQNQPENGTPLFGYGSLGYTLITRAGGQLPAVLPVALAAVGILAVGLVAFVLVRRRGAAGPGQEEDE